VATQRARWAKIRAEQKKDYLATRTIKRIFSREGPNLAALCREYFYGDVVTDEMITASGKVAELAFGGRAQDRAQSA
jgi:hypothetical protein